MYKNLLLPAALLSATIIGGGMFALPYAASKAGLLTALFYLVVFGGVFCLTHLMYGEVILKTTENHRFAGYAKIHMGEFAKWAAIFSTIIGMFFTLAAELVLSVSFINLFLPQFSEISKLLFVWAAGSFAVFFQINRLAISEFLMSGSIIFIILLVFGYGLGDAGNLLSSPFFNLSFLFLPYGLILFALDGRPAIPALMGYFRNNGESQLKARRAILFGTLVPAIAYALFVIGVLAISSSPTTDSVSGLRDIIPYWLLALTGILGFISLFSTYIVIGRDIKKSLGYDLYFPPILSGALVVLGPLFIYFSGFQKFIELAGLVGGLFIGLEGILIILMWRKVSKIRPLESFIRLPALIVYPLVIVFLGGILYTILG